MSTASPTAGAATLAERFTSAFGHPPEGIWSAPGRVNLIGEHTDYNEGFVLPFAIDRSTRVAVRRRADGRVRVLSGFDSDGAVTADVGGLAPGSVSGWSAYPLGVVWSMREASVDVPGMDMLFDSDVPVGAGLSSSAAIECAAAVAVNELAAAGLSAAELVLIGQRAENDVVGAPTGIMDQSASLLGAAGSAVFLDCQSQHSELVPLDLAGTGLVAQIIDTKVSHSHATGGYADRRASCERGAAALGLSSLRGLAPSGLPQARELLDEETFRRVRHVVTENERVRRTCQVLAAEGPAAIGELLDSSHVSMRDDFEISCPELDLAVETAREHGAIGARMTGGGFGGSAIALTPVDRAQQVSDAVAAAFAGASFTAPDVFAVQPAAGARRID
ncbi:galactokinase [Arthrobacter castelli]|uniref:galactokinase n=1 Tax=Arthrobacter castelli TaxID=271431 RepID=UPI00041E651F|nr:galactokinase [Arthrobacter castelli]